MSAPERSSEEGSLQRLLTRFVLTRLALIGIGLAAPLLVARPEGRAEIGPPVLAMWARWDGPIYLTIAERGYFLRDDAPVTAFFPLYPWVMQLLTLWSSNRELLAVAGVAVSNAALVVALAYLLALARLDFSEAVGLRVGTYYLVVPTTLFLSAVYTESLFLALSVASFYHARRGQLAAAGILGFLAALTRPYGALLAVPLAVEAVRHRRLPLWAVPPLLGPPVFFGWLWLEVGTPLAWFRAQSVFGRHLALPWESFIAFFGREWQLFGLGPAMIDLVAAVILIGLTMAAVVRLPCAYGALAAVSTLLLLMTADLQSMPRYAISVFPAFFVLGIWGEDRRLHWALVAISLPLALLAMARFGQWQWLAWARLSV